MYCYTELRRLPLLGALRRGIKYFRRFRLIRTVFTVFSVVFALLGTGLAVLVLTVLSLVVLPLAVLFGFSAVFISTVFRRRALDELEPIVKGRRVSVLFPERARFESGFFEQLCRRFANEGEVVIIVTPCFVSAAGFGARRPFVTYREEAEGLYLVRRYLFFALRKRLLESKTERTVEYF